MAHSRPVYLNGRFVAQSLTGVQRFATEMTRALGALPAWKALDAVLLAPAGTVDPGFAGFRFRTTGRQKGHVWEQWDLAGAAGNGLLLNLGNTGPLRQSQQIVIVHDAGVFSASETYGLPFRTWYRFLYRRLAKRAKLVTVSDFARRDLAAKLHIDPDEIAVISEGAEHILRPAADPSVLAANGLTAGRYALVVGSLAPHKNLAALSATATDLAQRRIQLAITGDLNTKIFASGTQSLLQPATYLGRVDDAQLRALYESAACLIFPSRYEGFGLPAVEAMACGCPVAAAKAGSLPEICDDAAVYFDPNDPADIAEIVTRLVDAPALGAELRRKGRLRVRRFTWTSAAQNLTNIVQAKRAAS